LTGAPLALAIITLVSVDDQFYHYVGRAMLSVGVALCSRAAADLDAALGEPTAISVF